MNIETKNTLFVIGLVLLVLLGAATTAALLIYNHVETESEADLNKAYNIYKEIQYQSFVSLGDSAYNLTTRSALLRALEDDRPENLRGLMQDLLNQSHRDLLVIYRPAREDTAVATRAELIGSNVTSNSVMRKLVSDANHGNKLVYGLTLIYDKLVQLAAIPVHDSNGKTLATLLVGKEMGEQYLHRIQMLVNAQLTLFRSNIILSQSTPGTVGVIERIPVQDQQGKLFSFEVNRKHYYGHVFPILDFSGSPSGVNLLVARPGEQQWATYSELFGKAGYASILIMLFAALFGIYISRSWLAKPIKSLASVAREIGSGNLETRVTYESRSDELGELARSFNQMRSQLLHAHKEEELSKDRLSDFAESSSDWLWETDADGHFNYVSRSVVTTLGVSADELIGTPAPGLFGESGSDISFLTGTSAHHVLIKDLEVWLNSREGYRTCLRLNAKPFYHDSHFAGYRGSARDITKSKVDEERLIRLANKDHLSGLSNRRRFMEDLSRETQLSMRQNSTGAIALIDLDHFKLVNDTAGHAAGDEVIIQVAALLRRLARSTDLVARLSGDEFAIAFIDLDEESTRKRVAEILRELGKLKPTYGGRILNVSASVGLVHFPEHGDNPVDLLAKADTAMYVAKKDGRNRAHLYSPSDQQQELLGSQLIWKERIHEALEKDLFILNYQPIRPTTGEAVSRYEVLIRMKSSDGSLHMPGSFIPMAEQFGLVHQIDRWVVRNALHSLASLDGIHAGISFSINLSGLSVGDDSMMRLIETELENTGVDRKRVIFEVTESAAFQDISRAINFISRIRQMGCRIALDDFGVGFSSFSYLKQLQPDVLKIDGSFIRDISNSREDQLFVKALVDVARGMGIMTVAEFVESEESLHMIRTLGVDYAQGYHIGMPVLELGGKI